MVARPCRVCTEHPAFGRGALLCARCLRAAGLLLDADGNPATRATEDRYAGRIRARAVRCGKNCARCPHGHYLYLCWRVGKQARETYLGKAPIGATIDPYVRPDRRRRVLAAPPAIKRAGKKPTRPPPVGRPAAAPLKRVGTSATTAPPAASALGVWRRTTTGHARYPAAAAGPYARGSRIHWVIAADNQAAAATIAGLSPARFLARWTLSRRGHQKSALGTGIARRWGPGLYVARTSTSGIGEVRPARADAHRLTEVDGAATVKRAARERGSA